MKKLLAVFIIIFFYTGLQAQSQTEMRKNFGYIDKADSVTFIFGEQQSVTVGKTVIAFTDKWRNRITQVNVAGSFNGWNNRNDLFLLKKINTQLYTLTLNKNVLGKKGEVVQFKFVLNHTYWIEPPTYALNKMADKDNNTNLYLRL